MVHLVPGPLDTLNRCQALKSNQSVRTHRQEKKMVDLNMDIGFCYNAAFSRTGIPSKARDCVKFLPVNPCI